MKKEVYLAILFDYYENLLDDKEKDYFTSYYFSNLSLGEIAENNNISRTAVHKKIKKIESILYDYENKIGLYDKEKRILELIEEDDLKVKIREILNR